MNSINEGSTAFLSVALEDKDGLPNAPSSATVAIRDIKTNTLIRPATAVTTMGATLEITITSSENMLLGSGSTELRRVTLRATYGVGDVFTDAWDYRVNKID